MLKDENRMIPAGLSTGRKEELRNHRDALSHPTTIRWRRPAMQAFADAHKQWTDFRAAIVFEMWNSMIAALSDAGGRVRDASIRIGPVHATMVHAIVHYAMKPEKLVMLDHLQTLLGQLIVAFGPKPQEA